MGECAADGEPLVTLRPGIQLLHFRLLDKLGEGGMGEVWRALDTSLDREVAIKILPPAYAGQKEWLARFEREAKVLASLNHPNIAAIHGFPEAPPVPGTTTPVRFLTMELVRGEDLANVIARDPMPIKEALDAAKQIAAALEAAHDGGIVHRDLKPANVKRTPEGQIKVLDFGLAKALESAAPNSGASATVTSAGTAAGVILGTASYMSPEQARGFIVDRRTDLWAFGCVLYEMLSGAKAFDGPSVTDVLAAIVKGEPDWDRLPAATPLAVRRLLRRCLEKDPRRRLRDAGDASLLLDDNPEDARTAPVPVARSRRGAWIASVALVAAIAAAAGYFWAPHGAAHRTSELTFHRLTFSRGMIRNARFAPDGHTVVYGAAWGGPPPKLYLARVEAAGETPVAVPPAELLAVSTKGELAVALGLNYAGWMGDGTLAQTSLLGGAPRQILEHVRAADWSPDGTKLAIVRRVGGFDQLEFPAGTVLDKTAGYLSDVRVSPDGKTVAYASHPVYADDQGDLVIIDGAAKKTALVHGWAALHGIVWAPGGREIWFTGVPVDTSFELCAIDLSGHRRTLWSSVTPIELFDVTADGRALLAAHRAERAVTGMLAGFSAPRPLVVSAGEASLSRNVTPDGRAALVTDQLPKEYQTYVVRADGSGAVPLAPGDGADVSPDGSSALVVSFDGKKILVAPLSMGTAREVPNPDGLEYEGNPGWLPDGKRFVVVGRRGSEPSRAYVVDAATGAAKAGGAPGGNWLEFRHPVVSPDGRSVILDDAQGARLLWPLDGGAPQPIPGFTAADTPLSFTEDGRGLFVHGKGLPIAVEKLDIATGRRTPWTTIAPADSAGLRNAVATMTPNGKYWTLTTPTLLTDLFVIDGLH